MLRGFAVAFITIAMIALGMGMISPGMSPVFAETAGGTGPNDTVYLSGTQSGTLDPGREFWYRIYDAGTNRPLGLALNYTPEGADTNPDSNPLVSFEVWLNQCSGSVCTMTKVSTATISGQPMGVKYWRGGSVVTQNYYVKVYNQAPVPISYAIAFTGETFPPPRLTIAPAAGPTTTPVEPTPAPAPTPATNQTAGGKGPESAAPINGIMSGVVTDQPVWYQFGFDGNGDQGVVMYFVPATVESQEKDNVVGFRVWTTICTLGTCTFTDVGGGTRSGQPIGVKYWRTSGQARTFFIQVASEAGVPVGYSLALSGSTFPPGGLPVPMP